jgi:hypothetical protein
MSELELEQRTNINFLVKFGKSGKEFRQMLVQGYGDNAMKKTAVYRWVKCFSEGRESVTDVTYIQNLNFSTSFSVRLHHIRMACICMAYQHKSNYVPRNCTVMFLDSHPTCLGLIRLLSRSFVNITARDV